MNIFNHISDLIYQVAFPILSIAGCMLLFALVFRPLLYIFPLFKRYLKNREEDERKEVLSVKEFVSKRFGVKKEDVIVESLEEQSDSLIRGFFQYMTKTEKRYRVFCEYGEFVFSMDMYDGVGKLTHAEMVSDTDFKNELPLNKQEVKVK
ncbi:hypothetical protein [Bacillus sp. NPDC094106]|uniref:hypothetical protein n=1 Tax=Bacillus sp. NPDC094106 TaxID=3363949 RepID=UPI0037F67BAA